VCDKPAEEAWEQITEYSDHVKKKDNPTNALLYNIADGQTYKRTNKQIN